MKRYLSIAAIILFTTATISCSLINKAKQKAKGVSASDLKKVADLVDMDFGSGPDGPFKVENAKTKDSKVVIQNNTDRTITVKATGATKKTFIVASKKSKSGIVKPGKYNFKATAKGVKGCEGNVALKRFKQYKWTFVIKKK